jgi:hypothetical protein
MPDMVIPESISRAPILLLTGAGASVPLGRYTTLEFWRQFQAKLYGLPPEIPEEAKQLAQQLAVWGAPATTDIENVLSLLQRNSADAERLRRDSFFMQSVLNNYADSMVRYESANELIRDMVQDEVISHYSTVDADEAAALYEPLIVDFRSWFQTIPHIGRTIPFFTLNYDRAVEAAASRLDVRCVDGLGEQRGATERRWNRERFERYEEGDQEITVVLVKLHGSVRWGWRGDIGGDIVELSAGVGRDPGHFKHVVLYPTELPKPMYVEPFRTGYRIFRECLNHALVLFVIGCSLRDQEIRTSISDAMDDNTELHVVVLGPDADHQKTADDLALDARRIAGVRAIFGTPVQTGSDKELMACLRGFAQTASGVGKANNADRLFRYGTTYDGWPWPSRQQLDAVLSQTSSSRLRHRFGQRG